MGKKVLVATAKGAEKPTKKQAGSVKPTIHSVAAKAAADNFKSPMWTHEDVYVRKLDNMTVFEKIVQALEKKAKGEDQTLGPKFYRLLKMQHRSASDPRELLKPTVANEPLQPLLVKAMIAAKKHHPDHTLMGTYIGNSPLGNETETFAIWKWALGLNPSDAKQRARCLEVLDWTNRLSLHTFYASKFQVMFAWYDGVLRSHAKDWLKKGKKPEDFVVQYELYCKLLMPDAPLQEIKAAKGDLTVCPDALSTLSEATETGQTLFVLPLLKVLSQLVGSTIQKRCDELGNGQVIDVALLNKHKYETLEAVTKLPNVDLLPDKRTIVFTIGQTEVPAKVRSIPDEIAIRSANVWKRIAEKDNQLPPLWCAAALNFQGTCTYSSTVAAELVANAKQAREDCKRRLEVQNVTAGDEIMQLVKKDALGWLNTDRDFGYEVALVEFLAGDTSELRLIEFVLTKFPTKDTDALIEDVFPAVNNMKDSNVYKLASRAAQGKLQVVLAMLGKILDERPPIFTEFYKDNALKKIPGHVKYFCRTPVAPTSDHEARTLIGSDALAEDWKAIKTKYDKGEATSKDVAKLKTFGYLVPQEITVEVQQAIAKIEEGAGISTTKAKQSKVDKMMDKKQDAAVAEAMAMFR